VDKFVPKKEKKYVDNNLTISASYLEVSLQEEFSFLYKFNRNLFWHILESAIQIEG